MPGNQPLGPAFGDHARAPAETDLDHLGHLPLASGRFGDLPEADDAHAAADRRAVPHLAPAAVEQGAAGKVARRHEAGRMREADHSAAADERLAGGSGIGERQECEQR